MEARLRALLVTLPCQTARDHKCTPAGTRRAHRYSSKKSALRAGAAKDCVGPRVRTGWVAASTGPPHASARRDTGRGGGGRLGREGCAPAVPVR